MNEVIVNFPVQLIIAGLGGVSTALLIVLVFFAKKFIATIEKMEDVQTQILERLSIKHEQIATLFKNDERIEADIRELQRLSVGYRRRGQ